MCETVAGIRCFFATGRVCTCMCARTPVLLLVSCWQYAFPSTALRTLHQVGCEDQPAVLLRIGSKRRGNLKTSLLRQPVFSSPAVSSSSWNTLPAPWLELTVIRKPPNVCVALFVLIIPNLVILNNHLSNPDEEKRPEDASSRWTTTVASHHDSSLTLCQARLACSSVIAASNSGSRLVQSSD
jgi:hypothetical protein